jgi:hypothetical protein
MANEVLTNPYNQIGTLHNQGLDYIISNLSNSPTTDELANLAAKFICISGENIPSPTAFDTAKHYASASYAMNSYLCADVKRKPQSFSNVQLNYYNQISETILGSDRNSIKQNLEALENEVIKSQISWKEQQPVLLAIAVGKASADYWNYQVDNQPQSAWANYIQQYPDPNTEVPKWVDTDVETFITTVIVEIIIPGGASIIFTAVVTAVAASAASTIWGWIKGWFS